MSPVRRLTLEEWFLDLQLRTVREDHVHLPFSVDLDTSAVDAAWAGRVPWPAVMIAALGRLGRELPEVNRMMFRTPFGARVFEPDGVHVNVPVQVEHEGRRLLSAVVVRDADRKSVEAIREELRAARQRDPRELPLNRHLLDGRDSLWRRAVLTAAWFGSYRLPWVYARHGGALALSSLHHLGEPGLVSRGVAFGPTSLTVLLFTGSSGTAQLGIGVDHAVLSGETIGRAVATLARIVASGDGLGPGTLSDATPPR